MEPRDFILSAVGFLLLMFTAGFCADDVGSILEALKLLKVQYSIFKLAAKVSLMNPKAIRSL